MDYCSACRRILNGALVCPGCGAYAPDIAPPAHHSHGTAASAATASQAWRVAEWPAPGSYPGTHHAEAEPIGSGAPGDATADASTTGASGGPEGTASTGQGRAARRRQLARWKKNKRRAAAATAVALVGGGLTVAALPATRSSNSHTRSLTAGAGDRGHPRTATTDSVSEQPDTQVPRHPGPHRPATTSRHRSATVALPHTATPSRQPKPAATAASPATSSATSDTTPESADGTHTGNAETPAQAQAPAQTPATTPPTSTDHSGTGPSGVHLLPITSAGDPTSPTQICLIAVCIG